MSYLWYWPSGGWDFEKWRADHPWQPPVVAASPPAGPTPSGRRKPTLLDWEVSRARLQEHSDSLLGRPPYSPPDRITWETIEERDQPDYRLLRLRYRLTSDENGYAWFAAPKQRSARRGAVIALHQTVPQGKDEPMGLSGDPELAYGRDLARRGFHVLAPDVVGFGERAMGLATAKYHDADSFFRDHPNCSVMGKMGYDVARALDLLAALPETRGMPVGSIGHSHGGYGTLFAMLAEPRIAAGVVSCGISPLRTDPTPERWWRMTALIPRLGYYEGRVAEVPVDFPDWMAMLAPRPLMVSAALQDACFPNLDTMSRTLDDVRRIYALHGAEGNLKRWIFRGGHQFPRAARTRAYAFLDESLG